MVTLDQAGLNHTAVVMLGASQLLDNLWRLEEHLEKRATVARADATDGGPLRRLRTFGA